MVFLVKGSHFRRYLQTEFELIWTQSVIACAQVLVCIDPVDRVVNEFLLNKGGQVCLHKQQYSGT